MSEAAIRNTLKLALDGVTDIGIVHDYERYANTWDVFEGFFRVTIRRKEQVRGWTIGYQGIPVSEREAFRTGSKAGIARTHRFQIMGIMGISDEDESEKTFAALAEDVCDALDDDDTLHGSTYIHTSTAVLAFDPSPFAGVLVHAAVISIDIIEAI